MVRKQVDLTGRVQPILKKVRLPLVEDWRNDKVGPDKMKEVMALFGFEERLKGLVLKNMLNERWRQTPIDKAVVDRLDVFDKIHERFGQLTRLLRWDEQVIGIASAIFMPFLDISERSCYTKYGHQYRSMQYAEMILDHRGTEKTERARILLGVLMHDIGKVVTDAEILLTPRTLSREDYARIKEHVACGRDMIEMIFKTLGEENHVNADDVAAISRIIYSHHEHFSGKGGYPKQSKGQEIDVRARITAFCDVLDAMTSYRVYREPLNFDGMKKEARLELNEQFNGDVVTDFLALVERAEIKERVYEIIRSGGGNP